MFNKSMAKDFLQNLFKHCEKGYLEMRPINNQGSKPKFFDLEQDGVSKALQYAKDLSGKYHVFYGVQPRKKRSGRDKDITQLITFWVDIDAKDHSNSKQKARGALNNFELEPSLLIDSGNGYHAYWILKEPWDIDNESDRKEINRISKTIHKATGGDSTANVSRILRLPGTPNIKDPDASGTPKTTDKKHLWSECKIISNSYTEYTINEIKEALPKSIEPEAKPFPVDFSETSKIHSLTDLKKYVSSNVLNRAKEMPAKLENNRSANDYWVTIKLYEAGLNDSEVYSAFKIFKNLNWDAGQKFKEHGKVYLDNTLPAAKGESANIKLPVLMDKIKSADGIDEKLKIAKDIYPILNYLERGKKDAKINELQDAFGGSRIMKKSTIKQMIKEEQTKTGSGRFFNVTPTGSLKFIPKKLGDYLLDKYSILNIESYLHYYDNGVFYDKATRRLINDKIVELLGDSWKEKYRDEAIGYIKDVTYIEPDNLPENDGIINVRNGMYDIRNGELLPHSPDYMSLAQVDVEYDADAKCPRLTQFMNEVFPEEVHDLVWEHAGYSLLANLQLKQFIVFIGEGNNGKSVWSTVIQEVLGNENYANQSIQDLSSDKNARAELFGKLANIYADLPASVIKETGTIKMLTGGDEITAEKKYKDPFTFKNKAKLIFSANQLPPITDYNEAFFDRVHIVDCPNRFDGSDADPFLIDKLTTEEAKSAWLNKAIKGAERLLTNKCFTVPEVVEEAVKSYRFSSDSVSEFLHTQINRRSGSFETKETVYAAYNNWCKSSGRHPVSERKFTRRAKGEPNSIEEFYPQVGNKQKKAWKNIALTDMSRKKYDSQNFL